MSFLRRLVDHDGGRGLPIVVFLLIGIYLSKELGMVVLLKFLRISWFIFVLLKFLWGFFEHQLHTKLFKSLIRVEVWLI